MELVAALLRRDGGVRGRGGVTGRAGSTRRLDAPSGFSFFFFLLCWRVWRSLPAFFAAFLAARFSATLAFSVAWRRVELGTEDPASEGGVGLVGAEPPRTSRCSAAASLARKSTPPPPSSPPELRFIRRIRSCERFMELALASNDELPASKEDESCMYISMRLFPALPVLSHLVAALARVLVCGFAGTCNETLLLVTACGKKIKHRDLCMPSPPRHRRGEQVGSTASSQRQARSASSSAPRQKSTVLRPSKGSTARSMRPSFSCR